MGAFKIAAGGQAHSPVEIDSCKIILKQTSRRKHEMLKKIFQNEMKILLILHFLRETNKMHLHRVKCLHWQLFKPSEFLFYNTVLLFCEIFQQGICSNGKFFVLQPDKVPF